MSENTSDILHLQQVEFGVEFYIYIEANVV